jgi:hypothetical protein
MKTLYKFQFQAPSQELGSWCLSVYPHETTRLSLDDFREFYLGILLTYVDKIQFLLKSDKNNRNFTQRHKYVFSVSLTPLTRAQWGCHETEAMAIPLTNSTDEIPECASTVALCVYILCCLSRTVRLTVKVCLTFFLTASVTDLI